MLLDERDRIQAEVSAQVSSASADQPGTQGATGQNLGELMQQIVVTESAAQAAQQQAEKIESQIISLRKQLQQFPAAQAKLIELQRQYDINEGVHNGLVAKVEETKVNSFSNYPSVQVLDSPKVDSIPSGSKKIPILMGTVLASIFGTIALMLFRESRNPLLSPKDVQKLDIPVIGTLPILQPTWSDLQGRSSLAFQRLASAISLMQLHQNRLMLTSAIAQEGRTTVIMGLGTALTALGFQVLVVDANIRRDRPRFPAVFNAGGNPDVDREALLPLSIAPGLDLFALSVPTSEILEFVAQGEFERTLTQLQSLKAYDYVLIDSAPICTTGETALMSQVVRDLLWVVRPGVSEAFALRKAYNQLARYHIRSIGLVINGHEAEANPDTNPESISELPTTERKRFSGTAARMAEKRTSLLKWHWSKNEESRTNADKTSPK